MIQTNFNHIVDGLRTFLPICDLRRAQLDIFEEFLSKSDQNITKGFFDLATGFGKTRMMTVLTESFLLQNPTGKVVVVVPTTALVKDENGDGMIKRFQDFHQMYHHEPLSIGAFYTYSKDTKSNIIVTTYSSLNTLAKEIAPKEVGLLLLDEAHHGLSPKRIEAIKEFSNACCYGLTATPAYSPDKSLESLLGSVISEMNAIQAVKDGLLAPCKNILLSSKIKVDLSAVSKTSQGEYQQHELEKILSQALMAYQSEETTQNWQNVHELVANEIAVFYQNYVDETLGQIQGKKCMINCRSQAEAILQARALNKVFGKTIAASWTTDTKDKTILNKFVNGDLPVLCQVGKLSEGFDLPELDMCINYPTCSKVVEAQRGGRVLRLNPENENKFALIVDVVFSHPDFDNPILSSHANGQVLYRDITNASVITTEKNDKAFQSNTKIQEREKNTNKKLPLEAFDVFSDIEELITLENEAQAQISKQNVPLKREGMLSAVDLAEKYKKDYKTFKKKLQQYYEEKQEFDVDEKKYLLVKRAKQKGNNYIIFVLDEHPKAIDVFKELLLKDGIILDIKEKRVGMKTASELGHEYNKCPKILNSLFHEFYQEGQIFSIENVIYPLIEKVRSGSRIALLLHEHPKAIDVFKELSSKRGVVFDIPKKRKGMKSARDLRKLFNRQEKNIEPLLEKFYKQKQVVKIKGKIYPLVEKVCSRTHIVLAINEHTEALDLFKELSLKESVNLYVAPKREGMLLGSDLRKIFKRDENRLTKLLNKLYCKKYTFTIDGITYPLVENVRNGGCLSCFALHEHPKALEFFKKVSLKEGEDFYIQDKRVGMKSSNELGKELNKNNKSVLVLLKTLYNANEIFEIDGVKYPLVEKVKSHSSIGLALHEHPKALEKFKQLLAQEGIVLEKRINTHPAPQGQKITDQRKLPTQDTSRGAREE